MFLVSLSSSSFLLAREKTRSLHSENCCLEGDGVSYRGWDWDWDFDSSHWDWDWDHTRAGTRTWLTWW